MREKWKKKRSRRLRRKRRKMRARSSTYTYTSRKDMPTNFCRVNAPTSVLAYVTSRSSVQATPRSDEFGVRSIRHCFTPVLAPDMRLSYRLHVHCAPFGSGCTQLSAFWSSVVEVVSWVVQINVLIFSQNQNKCFLPDHLCLSKGILRVRRDYFKI
ncbi:uncharacterized protein LACBIDRAFT_317027 [Laccaria bicolor S238N-H82]|uniref:60S ribosomal protein L41 n=1 Tax=Laccaria bicolor (strain S238N-H82 / ATCC MYA-4686) TaxID=486041 RepID=B0D482_LACBS|nr:uncharacterized protein LACBIDRAFT_317027 [Laccaria bicolor S238N-H82]EDR10531.1 predicted protein [Laccaria bicolor S238N-H82]|eukprot:XP_001878981.1 predicted protein [Laccaria bicolor S238N-H82]